MEPIKKGWFKSFLKYPENRVLPKLSKGVDIYDETSLVSFGNNHFLALRKKKTTWKLWGNNDETSIRVITENVESRKCHYILKT